MIRNKWGLSLLAALLFAPLSASAIGVTLVSATSSGGDAANLDYGDVLTLNVRVENPGNLDIAALGIVVSGYDVGNDGEEENNQLFLAGGAVASSVLNTANPAPGQSFGGIANVHAAPVQQGAPFPFNQPLRTALFEGAALGTSNGDGSLDQGVLVPTEIFNGDVHFSVQFSATGGPGSSPGLVTLQIGDAFQNGAVDGSGNVLPFTNATFTTFVVPEPGTALLMGLGLIGLAGNRRR